MFINRLVTVRHLVGLGLLVASLTIYLSTLAPTLTWRNIGSDGGDLIAASYNLGIPHPPGYPAYILLLKIFASLVPIGSFAFRANLFSALLGATAVVLLYYTVLFLLEYLGETVQSGKQGSRLAIQPLPASLRHLVAAFAAVAFAFSPVFWSQATITEVYTLNACLASALIFVAVRTGLPYKRVPLDNDSQRKALKGISLSAFLLGLAMGNHMTILLLAPFLFLWYGLALGWRRVLHPYPVVALLVGLSVYLYLPVRASQTPPINWGNADNLKGFLWMITAAPYRDYLFTLPLSHLPQRIASWADLFFRQFNVLGVFLGLLGSLYLWRVLPRLLLMTAGFAIALTMYSLVYYTRDSFVYLIPAFYIFALWMGLGLVWLLHSALPLVIRGKAYLGKVRYTIALTGVALIAIPGASLLLNYSSLDLSGDHEASSYSQELFRSLPAKSLVFAWSEKDVFGLWYMRYVEEKESDITVVSVRLLQFDWYWDNLRIRYPERVPEEAPEDVVSRVMAIAEFNTGRVPVYVTYKDRGLGERFKLVAEGKVYRVE
ncbi:MAG: DUF2723 domain-containing protein [Chloroflexi bacterium]|nr:DUF2723 domain-containing protein [Chloroflexota bacterium]